MLCHAEPAFLFLALPFAVMVASSRVILGLHYPSDVLVGAMIGAALGAVSVTLE
jgi:undecaprenyl-diphosphatase